jgi:hypothetical protein
MSGHLDPDAFFGAGATVALVAAGLVAVSRFLPLHVGHGRLRGLRGDAARRALTPPGFWNCRRLDAWL